RAGADDADPAVGAGLGLQPAERRFTVGDHAVVVHTSFRTDLGRHVVRGAVPVPAVEVGADHGVAVAGEPLGELLVELVPPRQVVHEHDAGKRAVGLRPGDVGVHFVTTARGVGGDAGGDGEPG